jgi:hypothetical protein
MTEQGRIFMRSRTLLFAAIFISYFGGRSGDAYAACSPTDFLVADIEHMVLSDQVKIAFLNTATKEQYDKASKAIGGTLAFGPAKAIIDLGEAKVLKRFGEDKRAFLVSFQPLERFPITNTLTGREPIAALYIRP